MWTVTDSPIGPLRIVADGHADDVAVVAVEFSPFLGPVRPDVERADAHPVLVDAARQLAEYFAGDRTEFRVPVRLTGTAFQQQVWGQILGIGWGSTLSYGDVAARLGSPSASRAVGMAAGRNPVPVIVPCHRIIGASGALTGYAGGLDRKQRLLELEDVTGRFARA